jgi:hypothetical protein
MALQNAEPSWINSVDGRSATYLVPFLKNILVFWTSFDACRTAFILSKPGIPWLVRRRITKCAALAQDEQNFTILLLRNSTRTYLKKRIVTPE